MTFSENHNAERAIGLEGFISSGEGVGGRLRRLVEDFVVDEVSTFPPNDDGGRFVIAKVTAINWETNRLVRHISKSLGVSRHLIGFAGTKDKRAISTQLMSIEAPIEKVRALRIRDVTVEALYRSRKNITIGDLRGNRFNILVSGCRRTGPDLTHAVDGVAREIRSAGGFPNYFGVQRFGALRPITHVVGRHIVKGDLEAAVMAYVSEAAEEEDEESLEARRALKETHDFDAAMRDFPMKLTFERTVIGWLQRNPSDYAGAIRVLPSNLQMMLVHAYQSFLFNRILSERMRRGLPLREALVGDVVLPADVNGLPDHDKHVPVTAANLDMVQRKLGAGRAYISAVLLGQDSAFGEGEMGDIERAVAAAEGLSPADFRTPALPDCNSRGSRREVLGRLLEPSFCADEDSVRCVFALDKGCYATVLLRELMKADIMDY
jgi:tRNA pseudouridine13 synthase